MQIIYAPRNGTINDGDITTSKLAPGAVTSSKIGSAQVTGSKIASGALGIHTFTGLAAAGEVSLGVSAGDYIIQVLDSDNIEYGGAFENPVLATGILRQNDNVDYSAKTFTAFVLSRTP